MLHVHVFASNEEINAIVVLERGHGLGPPFCFQIRLKADADLKTVLSCCGFCLGRPLKLSQLIMTHISTVAVLFDMDMLTTIPNTIRDVLIQVAVHIDQCKDASCPFSKCTSTCSSSQSAKATYMRSVCFFQPRWITLPYS